MRKRGAWEQSEMWIYKRDNPKKNARKQGSIYKQDRGETTEHR